MSTTETKEERTKMRKKVLIILFIISTLSITACGKQESLNNTNTTEQQEQTETIEETTETEVEAQTEQSDPTEETEQESLSSEATNSEGLTVDEAVTADVEYIDELVKDYDGDLFTKYDAYVKDQGADELCGAWLIYYYGSAAGDQRSYAINQRTGEKIVAGPYSYFYGSSELEDDSSPFWGTDKTYPGDEFPEFEENMTLAIQGLPAHTNGQ